MKKVIFFVRRAIRDYFEPHRFFVSEKYLQTGDEFPYGLDYTSVGMAEYYNMKFDANGIIMMAHYIDHLTEISDRELHYYSPVKIAHYALGAYNDFLKTGNAEFKEAFFKHVDFLYENCSYFNNQKNIVVWKTPTSNPKYFLPENYISCIVQGLSISALVRAYLVSNEQKYLKMAIESLAIFHIPVEDGGIYAKSRWGDFYEEYPCLPYSHVVNGFMFALMGLYDLWHVSRNEDAKELYDQGTETLSKILPVWFHSYWTKYDLWDVTKGGTVNLAAHHYQCLHADQLWIIFLQTQRKEFKDHALIIEEQLRNKRYLAKVYLNKFKLLLLKK